MCEHSFRALWGAFLLSGLVLWVGCDDTLIPFAEDTGLYSIYGALTLAGDEHFIRIKNLNDPSLDDSMRVLDANVTLKNLETGTAETLTDSIVTFEGIYTHNFRTDQEIQPGATYQLTVERSDGRSTQATATMPVLTELDVKPPEPDTVSCKQGLLLTFQNVPEQNPLRVSVGIVWNDKLRWVSQRVPTQFSITPWRTVEKVVPDHILEPISDREDYCTVLDEDEIHVAYTQFSPDWPADSVLADPTASRVENGLGVFGGVHRDTLSRIMDR